MNQDKAQELAGWLRHDNDNLLADLVLGHVEQECDVCDALYDMLKDDE